MRRAGKTAIRRAHNPENQVQLLGLATIFALADALWKRLRNELNEVFFEPGMTLEIRGDGSAVFIADVATEGFDRRKGRREALADAWREA